MASARLAFAAALAVVAAACGSVSPSLQLASATPVTVTQLLGTGEFSLPVANAFEDPGFHGTQTLRLRLPAGLGPTAGRRLVLGLRDASRPSQRCGSDHPLSGCATVDWSDAPDRPHVPPGGVFINSLTLALPTGPRVFFLSQGDRLADAPDAFQPG